MFFHLFQNVYVDSPRWALYIRWLFLLPFWKYAWCTCKGKITTLQSDRPTQKFVLIKKTVSLASTQILHLLLFYSSPSLPQSLALPILISEAFSSSHSHHPPPCQLPHTLYILHKPGHFRFLEACLSVTLKFFKRSLEIKPPMRVSLMNYPPWQPLLLYLPCPHKEMV